MGAQLRAVRQRIRAIQSTAKITRAQELIASSRIIQAQQRVRASAPYAEELTRAVEAVVSRSSQIDHPLVNEPASAERVAVLILTSDRGFAGGYNANVLREAQRLRALLEEERRVEVQTYVSGTKGITWHRFRDREVAGEWRGFSERPGPANAAEIATAVLEAFEKPTAEGGVDEIHLVYTEFVSMLTQRPTVRRILPLEVQEVEERQEGLIPPYEFEPSPQAVLDALLPWYVENRIYHALLQSAAAEIAARRRAMKAATDNANDLLEQFSREANKARQAEITQEISEIVGGANALAETISGSE
jgi:F-type H+-transporting ATPase subunit gamma